jgi:hypothetical protein
MNKSKLVNRVLTTLLIVYCCSVYAQKDSLRKLPKIFVSVNGGLSAPFGDYSAADNRYQEEEYVNMGFAEPGYYYNILAGIDIGNQKWEPQMMFSYEWNGVNVGDFLSANAPFYLGVSLSQPIMPVLPLTNKASYSFYNFMPGIARTFKGKYVSFDIKLMLGYIREQFPVIKAYVNPNDNTFGGTADVMTMGAASYSAVCYDVGAGLKFFITPRIIIMCNVDILSSIGNMNFNIPVNFTQPTEVSTNHGASWQNVTATTWQFSPAPISQANVSFGVGYAFPYGKGKN